MNLLFGDYLLPKVVSFLFSLFVLLVILLIIGISVFILMDNYYIPPFGIILLIIADIAAGGLLILLLIVWAERTLILFDIADNTKKQAEVFEKICYLMENDREKQV